MLCGGEIWSLHFLFVHMLEQTVTPASCCRVTRDHQKSRRHFSEAFVLLVGLHSGQAVLPLPQNRPGRLCLTRVRVAAHDRGKRISKTAQILKVWIRNLPSVTSAPAPGTAKFTFSRRNY